LAGEIDVSNSQVHQLKAALDDLEFIQTEKDAGDRQIIEQRHMIDDLRRDNEDMKARLEQMTVDRDKYKAFSVEMMTRLTLVSENIQSTVAACGRHALSTAGRQRELRQETERDAVAPPRRHPHAAQPPVRERVTVPEDEGSLDRLMERVAPPPNEYPR
jgi:hypothetical protein